MGAPSSSILSEVYLQFLENTQIYNILLQHQIVGYFRYVDDILIVYNNNNTEIHNNNTEIHKVLDQFNNISPTLTFTIEKEQNKCISFLDISICNNQKISFNVYRKPTTTDIIIPKIQTILPNINKQKFDILLLTNNISTQQHEQRKRIWHHKTNFDK